VARPAEQASAAICGRGLHVPVHLQEDVHEAAQGTCPARALAVLPALLVNVVIHQHGHVFVHERAQGEQRGKHGVSVRLSLGRKQLREGVEDGQRDAELPVQDKQMLQQRQPFAHARPDLERTAHQANVIGRVKPEASVQPDSSALLGDNHRLAWFDRQAQKLSPGLNAIQKNGKQRRLASLPLTA
jgi:hypothetical protein